MAQAKPKITEGTIDAQDLAPGVNKKAEAIISSEPDITKILKLTMDFEKTTFEGKSLDEINKDFMGGDPVSKKDVLNKLEVIKSYILNQITQNRLTYRDTKDYLESAAEQGGPMGKAAEIISDEILQKKLPPSGILLNMSNEAIAVVKTKFGPDYNASPEKIKNVKEYILRQIANSNLGFSDIDIYFEYIQKMDGPMGNIIGKAVSDIRGEFQLSITPAKVKQKYKF